MCLPIRSCNLTLALNKAVFSLGNSPIIRMTTEVQGQENIIILDLIREPGPESDWLNRSCRNPETGVTTQSTYISSFNNTLGNSLLLPSVTWFPHRDSSWRYGGTAHRRRTSLSFYPRNNRSTFP